MRRQSPFPAPPSAPVVCLCVPSRGCFACGGRILATADPDSSGTSHACLLCGRDQHVYRDGAPSESFADPQRHPAPVHKRTKRGEPRPPRPQAGIYDGVYDGAHDGVLVLEGVA